MAAAHGGTALLVMIIVSARRRGEMAAANRVSYNERLRPENINASEAVAST